MNTNSGNHSIIRQTFAPGEAIVLIAHSFGSDTSL